MAAISAITMPKWGIEMTEGTVAGWRVGEGRTVERGAEILDVETDKIVNAVEAPASGVLRRILAKDGEVHPVGALIGVIAEADSSDGDIAHFIESFVAAVVSFDPGDAAATPAVGAAGVTAAPIMPAPAKAGAGAATGGATSGVTGQPGSATGDAAVGASDESRVSPIARRVAERLGVDLSRVTGTGRNGRISKEDVETFAAVAASAAPAQHAAATPGVAAGSVAGSAPGVHRLRMSARRTTIARRLLESKQSIPHFRLEMSVDFGPLLQHRRALDAAAGGRITVNDLLLRATALALVHHPMVNAQLEGDEILQFENADIAIAVAAEAGLVTPIVRNANRKSVAAIAAETRDLIERARRGALLREEISGGSFTISNLGMHGVERFDAIINAPQVAILAVGAASQRPVVRAGVLAVADIVTLTLSADHRVIDGAVGAAFLGELRGLIEKPSVL